MSSTNDKLNRKIDKVAKTMKSKVGRVIGNITDAKDRAAAQVREDVHDVGMQIKKAGEKIMKSTDDK